VGLIERRCFEQGVENIFQIYRSKIFLNPLVKTLKLWDLFFVVETCLPNISEPEIF